MDSEASSSRRTRIPASIDERRGSSETPWSNASQPDDRPSSPILINVLIMNLPFRARWQDLKDLCRQACHIERADVALEIDGRSRGFGEVTCTSRADADRLFKMFDGFEWQNRKLSVIVMDRQQPPPTNVSGDPYAGGNNPRASEFRPPSGLLQPQLPTDDKLLFVGNLPFSMQWQDLKDLLRAAGRVQRTDISMSSDGRSRGWGTALFATSEEAQRAVEMFNNTELEGRTIKVRLDRLGGRGVPANPRPMQSAQYFAPIGPGYPLQHNFFAGYDRRPSDDQQSMHPQQQQNQQQQQQQQFQTQQSPYYPNGPWNQ